MAVVWKLKDSYLNYSGMFRKRMYAYWKYKLSNEEITRQYMSLPEYIQLSPSWDIHDET